MRGLFTLKGAGMTQIYHADKIKSPATSEPIFISWGRPCHGRYFLISTHPKFFLFLSRTEENEGVFDQNNLFWPREMKNTNM